ncbi:MAG: acylneuraminate cytidylyltransferase family protein [Planctomycetota bacterium]
MRAVALILARSGSKGVPNKNVRLIAGRPCICWTIDAALQAERIDQVVVSTDGEEIATVAREAGAAVIERPAELATDRASVDDAARHAVQQFDAAPDHVALLYANVPVRPAGLIDHALHMLETTGADSVQSYTPVGKYHPWWTAVVDEDGGSVRPWEGSVLNHGVFRRQDLPPAHIPDGGVIALTRQSLMLEVPDATPGPHAFFGADRRGVVTGEGQVIDIDAEVDLLVAESILRGTPLAAAGAP